MRAVASGDTLAARLRGQIAKRREPFEQSRLFILARWAAADAAPNGAPIFPPTVPALPMLPTSTSDQDDSFFVPSRWLQLAGDAQWRAPRRAPEWRGRRVGRDAKRRAARVSQTAR